MSMIALIAPSTFQCALKLARARQVVEVRTTEYCVDLGAIAAVELVKIEAERRTVLDSGSGLWYQERMRGDARTSSTLYHTHRAIHECCQRPETAERPETVVLTSSANMA